MLQSEGGWTLNLQLDSSVRRISIQKTGTLALQDARLLCGKRRAYAAIGGGLDAESAIRLSGQKDLDTKTGTLALQNARLSCDNRMAYVVVGGGLYTEPAIRHLSQKDSIQKQAPRLCRMPDCHATSAWHMLRSEGG